MLKSQGVSSQIPFYTQNDFCKPKEHEDVVDVDSTWKRKGRASGSVDHPMHIVPTDGRMNQRNP